MNKSNAQVDRVVGAGLKRRIGGCLLAIALLPPFTWSMLGDPYRQWLASRIAAPDSLWISTLAIAAISAVTAALIGVLIFTQPLHRLQRAERDLRQAWRRDPLTGLLNREGMQTALEQAMRNHPDKAGVIGVLMLDLDNFSVVNKSLGGADGDALLKQAAARISSVIRSADPLARVGADKFVVAVGGRTGLAGMNIIATNLQRAFREPFKLDSRHVLLTPSVGMVVSGGARPQDLIGYAEVAVRSAKSLGGARNCWYEPTDQCDDVSELDVQLRLHHALERDEFMLLYQPVLRADGQRIVGVEALIRWRDPMEGIVSPDRFIPVLEQTGLIIGVGRWVLQQACEQGRIWIEEGADELVVSVNVSPRQFAEADLVKMVDSVLEQTGFPSGQLQLEITEGILLDPSQDCLRKLQSLAERGVRIALDDFGMGYSSLAYLKHFPLHTLKIDRNFVKDLPGKPRDVLIAQAIVNLGLGLGLHVTAEGVETVEQFNMLSSMGCESMQGFLFNRPLEVKQISTMLRTEGGLLALPPTPEVAVYEKPYRLQPMRRRVRISRNGEVLGDSRDALWLLDESGELSPTVYLPRHDVTVALAESGDVQRRRYLGEQHYLDLLSRTGHVVSPAIAWEYQHLAPEVQSLQERIAFNADRVVVEELPLEADT